MCAVFAGWHDRAMPILPVKLFDAEIYCCGQDHEAKIGEVWRCPVNFHARWWQEADVPEPGWSVVARGLVRAQGTLKVASERAPRPLMDLGACTVGFSERTTAAAVTAEGTVIGD
jgi:hypothetical protein